MFASSCAASLPRGELLRAFRRVRRLLLARLNLRHLVRVLFSRRRHRLVADDAMVEIFQSAHVAEDVRLVVLLARTPGCRRG